MAADSSFPALLADAFDEAALERSGSTLAILEPTGEIVWVSSAWRRFAEENGGAADLEPRASYFLGIAPPLRDYYQRVFTKTLQTGEVFTQEYECSSPTELRLYHLRVLPIRGRFLMVEHSLVKSAPHDPGVDAIANDYRDPRGFIRQCSNCRRINRPDERSWDWVPVLVARRDPKTTHGLCPSCEGFYWGLDAPQEPGGPTPGGG